jgi:uncharacterized membrane protein (DUF485 family)
MSVAAHGKTASPGHASRAHDLLNSPEFKALVTKRWTVSTVLLVLLFVTYYGYVLLIAGNKEAMSQRLSDNPAEVTTIAIPVGVGVIVAAFLLTAVYVLWANTIYDPEVKRLREKLKS